MLDHHCHPHIPSANVLGDYFPCLKIARVCVVYIIMYVADTLCLECVDAGLNCDVMLCL